MNEGGPNKRKEILAANSLSGATSLAQTSRDFCPALIQNSTIAPGTPSPLSAGRLPSQQNSLISPKHMSNNEGSQKPNAGCTCLGHAVAIVEEIEIQKQQSYALNADVILSLQARALDRCDALIKCNYCANISHTLMLLILLCEKLLASRLQPEAAKEGQQLHSEANQHVQKAGKDDKKGLDSFRILFGEYEVSSWNERVHVTQALQSCFKQRLVRLLGDFEGLAASKGWQTQLMMVVNLKNRIQHSI